MNCTTVLPTNYTVVKTIDFKQNKGLVVGLTLCSAIAFFVFGALFFWLAFLLSPSFPKSFTATLGLSQISIVLLTMILTTVLVLLVHETIHGLCFWLFTRKRPLFGLKWGYAYASAPEWYIPRGPSVANGLAPLVAITLCGLALFPFVPFMVTSILIFALTINAAGAVGDLYVVSLLLTKPASILVRDYGDGMVVYGVV